MPAFATPAPPGEGVNFKDHLGALLLVEVTGVEERVKTVHGEADAIKAELHAIDGAGAPASYSDTLIFPKILVSQLKKSVGQKVLGRLTQGVAKPGQDPPWILAEAVPADIALAEAWIAKAAAPQVVSAPPF